VLRAYKYRIYPNVRQEVLLSKHFGCVRYIYNWGLNKKNEYYQKERKSIGYCKLSALLPNLKKELKWLGEVNAKSLQQALRNLDVAFGKHFKEGRGFPKFKSKKDSRQAFGIPQYVKVDFENRMISIHKIGSIKAVFHRRFNGKIRSATFSKTPTGKYFVSILVDDDKKIPKKDGINARKAIGIDLGLSDFATLSTGEKIENPRFLEKNLAQLQRQQRKLSCKVKGSKNRDKQRLVVARLHEKITNQRNDFLHKLTHKLTHDNQVDTICVEDLNVSGMIKNRHLSRGIADVSWSKFLEFLRYKCEWYGKNLLACGRFDPSSKTCSCGAVNKNLKLSDRTWVCPDCGTVIEDRDLNAAQNIKTFALQRQKNIGREPPESTPAERRVPKDRSMKQEAIGILSDGSSPDPEEVNAEDGIEISCIGTEYLTKRRDK
jgi:putative transposase